MKRTRLYNPVELIEFFTNAFVETYSKKLMDFVVGFRYETKRSDKSLALESMKNQTAIVIDSKQKILYDFENGICQCQVGKEGASCKHSLFLSSLNYRVPNEICSHLKEVKLHLFWIARGTVPEENFMANLNTVHGQCQSSNAAVEHENDILPAHEEIQPNDELPSSVCNDFMPSPEPPEQETEDYEAECDESNISERMNSACDHLVRLCSDKEMKKALECFTKFVEKNVNKTTGHSKIIDALKNLESKPINKKIRVQKASIQRRVCGRTTTSSVIAGRQKTISFIKPRSIVKKAKKHNLKTAIDNNEQNRGKF